MTVELAHVEIINEIKTGQGHAIPAFARAVERDTALRKRKHAESCDCFACRDNRKWNQRFEALHGAEMRAYYAPKEPQAGVSASGLEEAGHYTYTSSLGRSKILADRHLKPRR